MGKVRLGNCPECGQANVVLNKHYPYRCVTCVRRANEAWRRAEAREVKLRAFTVRYASNKVRELIPEVNAYPIQA